MSRGDRVDGRETSRPGKRALSLRLSPILSSRFQIRRHPGFTRIGGQVSDKPTYRSQAGGTTPDQLRGATREIEIRRPRCVLLNFRKELAMLSASFLASFARSGRGSRSEERRVGKEC